MLLHSLYAVAYDRIFIDMIFMSVTGGFDMNSAFSSTHFIENKKAQSFYSSDKVKSKQNLKHEGLFLLSSANNKGKGIGIMFS